MASSAASVVEFFFDPACPWTWLTSRWIVDVADQTDIDVRWHALSLGLLNMGSLAVTDETPDRVKPSLTLSTKVLRIVEHLATQDRNAEIGRFYTAIGTALHVDRRQPGDALLAGAIEAAGIGDVASVADDASLDAAVTASHDGAQSLLAGDTGSPVIAIDGVAIFGPIVSPAPTGAEALALWDAVQSLLTMPAFFELKRNRDGPPRVT